MEVIYITHEQAIETHKKTIEYSGGGDMSILNNGAISFNTTISQSKYNIFSIDESVISRVTNKR